MKTKLFILISFLLIASCAFSQTIQIDSKGDTSVVTPLWRIKAANHLFIQSDSLQAELSVMEGKIQVLNDQILTYKLINTNQNQQINIFKEQKSILQDNIIQLKKEIKAVKRRCALITFGTGAVSIALTLLVIIL